MARRSEYIVAVVVNVILLYIANSLLFWDIPFVTDSWSLVLPIFNLALVATIIANLLFLAHDPFLFRESAKLVLNVLGIAFLYTLYRVFPFDLSTLPAAGVLTLAVRIAIILAIVATIIAMIVQIYRIISRRPRDAPR